MWLWMAKLLGLVIFGLGIAFTIKPQWLKRLLDYLEEGNHLLYKAAFRIVIGAVFLLAAPQARVVPVLVTFGVLFTLSGILMYAIGIEKLKGMIAWWKEMSPTPLRLFALIPVFVGAMILYST
ncbi:MAG TPA: hypothetical protein VD913_02035 [bacterium]|nr:hypothetical protein [bacterium]